MRHRRSQRHPVIESAVFVAAVLLAAFIARELWSRRQAPVPAASSDIAPIALNPGRPPLPDIPGARRTEAAVTGVAPIKLTRVQRRKLKSVAVPLP